MTDESAAHTAAKADAVARERSPVDRMPLTIAAAAAALRSGEWSALALLETVEARADKLDPLLGTFITRTSSTAVEAARQADADFAAGVDRGPLQGIPLGIKDIISTVDAPTTAQSHVLASSFGDQGDAVVVSRLRAAGAVIVGKTTTMEYALGAPDETKGFPIPRNPFDLERWPGGSSSGTASGVQAGMFLGGLGTDTGGSVRLPSSWTGISGHKPTFGLVPKSGCVPLSWTLDAIGPMSRSARDCALLLNAIAGFDGSDRSAVPTASEAYEEHLTGTTDGLRLGVDLSLLEHPDCDPDVARLMRDAVAVFEASGADLHDVRLPLYDELTVATYVSLGAEALAYHRNDLQGRWDDYGAPTRMAAAFAAMSSAADYIQAQRVRRVGVEQASRLFEDVDVVLTATCLTDAPLVDGLTFDSIVSAINTRYWNALGFPAISIPMGMTTRGLPAGLHIGGRPFDDAVVLRVADAFQHATTHHLLEPPLLAQISSGA